MRQNFVGYGLCTSKAKKVYEMMCTFTYDENNLPVFEPVEVMDVILDDGRKIDALGLEAGWYVVKAAGSYPFSSYSFRKVTAEEVTAEEVKK